MLAMTAGLAVGTAVAALALRARLRRRYYERLLDTRYGDLPVAQRRGLRAVLPQLADLEPAMAGAIAGYSAYQVAWSLEHLDLEVLAALRYAEGHDLATYNQLAAYVRDHFTALTEGAREGTLAHLTGFAGEQEVAGHLSAAGHRVAFPAEPNNPGYDLLVDGTPVQVKTSAATSVLNEHLARYPHVPVITNVENQAYADTHPGVTVDPLLSHAQVKAEVAETLDALENLDGLGAHLPVVTALVAGIREGRLLLRGDTDLWSAGKNVALDVGSVGAGAALGAKAGLLLGGAFLGPLGAGVAGILGALYGSIMGRKASTWWRRLPYERAKAAFEGCMRQLGEEVLKASRDFLRQREERYRAARRKFGGGLLRRLFFPGLQDVLGRRILRAWRDYLARLRAAVRDFAAARPEERALAFCQGRWPYVEPGAALHRALAELEAAAECLRTEAGRCGMHLP